MAGGTMGDGDDGGLITDINVTPLVDIVLVLLIILMVTATAIVSRTIPMELPKAGTGQQTPSTATLAVSIDAGGKLFLDQNPVDWEELRTNVRRARTNNAEVRALIAADGRTPHSQVVRVIDLLRQEKVVKFAINVRPKDLKR